MVVTQILVGIDGSPESIAAAQWAAELAERLDATVVAVHVLGLLEHLDADHNPVQVQGNRPRIEALFTEVWSRPLASRRVSYRTELVYGSPLDALLRTAKRVGADLLVVGARGTGSASGPALGSTSSQLVREADRPVVVVPTRRPSVQGQKPLNAPLAPTRDSVV
jgi:nucleotide-binding universal stress UspA family protein